jgi:chromosome segregation ATPase
MATDPYHTFAADLRSSLDQARQLSQRYQALQVQRNREAKSSSTYPQSPSNYRDNVDTQLHDTYNQLQEQLETIENDINDVQESVEMLEKRGPALFNVDSAELGRRKRFVQSCTDEVRVSLS